MGKLTDAMTALDKDGVLAAVNEALAADQDPLALVEEARQGLEAVGEAFNAGTLFLMELMWGAEIFKEAMALISPRLKALYGSAVSKGVVLVGTVKGDVHDLGKNIVKSLLECNGFSVVDLGVDAPPEAFVAGIREHNPQVVGMSALLTAAIAQVNLTVEAIEQAGLRDRVKIIVGGGIVGEVKKSAVNVDYAAVNASEGIHVIEGWFAA